MLCKKICLILASLLYWGVVLDVVLGAVDDADVAKAKRKDFVL
jgi:hypothetical protein